MDTGYMAFSRGPQATTEARRSRVNSILDGFLVPWPWAGSRPGELGRGRVLGKLIPESIKYKGCDGALNGNFFFVS